MFVWTNAPGGTYKLSAVAKDEYDSRTAPETPVITVSPASTMRRWQGR